MIDDASLSVLNSVVELVGAGAGTAHGPKLFVLVAVRTSEEEEEEGVPVRLVRARAFP